MKNITVQTTSCQHVTTPGEWLHGPVCDLFPCGFDLACVFGNARFPMYYTELDDALSQDWNEAFELCSEKYLWLNPPFGRPEPKCESDCSKDKCLKRGYHNLVAQKGLGAWMEKCASEGSKGVKIVSLTPTSLGSKWYREIVKNKALSLILPYRLTFEGEKNPYPKELMLNIFGTGMTGLGYFYRKK